MDNYKPTDSFSTKLSALAHDVRGDEDQAVQFLAEQAGRGPILEFAIGTGRLALPLVEQGFEVHGIDFSEAMLKRLQEKPNAEQVQVVLGDFVTTRMPHQYSLVFIAWNSFFNVLTQHDQVTAFQNAAQHLTTNGRFVIEAFTPNQFFTPNHQTIESQPLNPDEVTLDVLTHHPATQTIKQNHVRLSQQQGIQITPVVQRYAWPAELDLMASLAGFELESRWASWDKKPFDDDSQSHVSVFSLSDR